MSKETTVILKGASGKTYNFDVFPWGTPFKPLGAIYTVLKKIPPNFHIHYVGETGDLSSRFDNHHKQPCFDRNGKTHIAVHLESSESVRLSKEADLVGNYNPGCNG